jgi:pimeloyl-ACP methyl ester carboxylesterase
MVTVHHRRIDIDGLSIYYREAGVGNTRNVLLLHGAPASSFMFRDLIPLLADKYHVIAPDYPGFGLSSAPSTDEFDYSFDNLARIIGELTEVLDFDHFAMYVQDYGAPIGWRLALNDPSAIAGIITQNGNAYTEGFVTSFWEPLWDYAANPSSATDGPLRHSLTEEAIRWQYLHGVSDETLVAAQRPGVPDIHLTLYRDYPTNVDLYPAVHEYFRLNHPPTLVVWGANDEIFAPAGARAFLRDLPDAELHLRDGGHFLLESDLEGTSAIILDFLAALWSPVDTQRRNRWAEHVTLRTATAADLPDILRGERRYIHTTQPDQEETACWSPSMSYRPIADTASDVAYSTTSSSTRHGPAHG